MNCFQSSSYNFVRPIFNLNEFIDQCAPHKQAVIYGFESCDYAKVIEWLKEEQSKKRFNRVLDYRIASFSFETFEGSRIKRINPSGGSITSLCKAALVNLVIENYKRERVGLPVIPLVFFIEKGESKLNLSCVLNKSNEHYKSTTNAEIRRAYKLCFDKGVSKDIRKIAQKTFKFVALEKPEKSDAVQYDFRVLAEPWKSEKWKMLWRARMEHEKPIKKTIAKCKNFVKNLVNKIKSLWRSLSGGSLYLPHSNFKIKKVYFWRNELNNHLKDLKSRK